MSHSNTRTATVFGGKVIEIEVEVDIRPGLPCFLIIGLPDRRIEEAKERIRAGIKNAGFVFPLGIITVNLSPSELRKQGTGFDLAILVGILQASSQIPRTDSAYWIQGEVSLLGGVKPYQELSVIIVEALRHGKTCVLPAEYTGALKGRVRRIELLNCRDLLHLPDPVESTSRSNQRREVLTDYAIDHIYGQYAAKRMLEIALAGGHNVLLTGPVGSGKTLLAQAAYQLLPQLTEKEELEVVQVGSLARQSEQVVRRPFRAPHHTVTVSQLLGGGASPCPGELSLAHRGILFLDECTLIDASVLDSFREPLEQRKVVLKRQGILYEYPAYAQIIAACNNCPCGKLGMVPEACACTSANLNAYQRKLSGAFYDRLHMQVMTRQVTEQEVVENKSTKQGKNMAQVIQVSRVIQYNRNGMDRLNSDLGEEELRQHVPKPVTEYVLKGIEQFGMSMRGMHKLLQVSLTIADLAQEDLSMQHAQEAMQYRIRHRMG